MPIKRRCVHNIIEVSQRSIHRYVLYYVWILTLLFEVLGLKVYCP